MTAYQQKGLLFVLVGPTGAGKNTIMGEVLNRLPNLSQLPTATTREIRPTEQEGREHHFLTMDQFQQMIANDELLEHQNVHGRLYGVPRKTVADNIEACQDRIADIDVIGAMNVREAFPDNTKVIFIRPGSPDDDIEAIIRHRLTDRGEPPAEIENRLQRVQLEMSYVPRCDYLIYNEDKEEAARVLEAIIVAERSRRDLLNLNSTD